MTNRFIKQWKIIGWIFAAVLSAGCAPEIVLPPDTSQIYTIENLNLKDIIRTAGKTDSNDVILIAQGGPIPRFSIKELKKTSQLRPEALWVLVAQKQIIYPEIFYSNGYISEEEARQHHKDTVTIFHRVVKHYQNLDKKVIAVGISYGAWVVQDMIAQKGYGNADSYIIAVGRLNMEYAITNGLREGNYVLIDPENRNYVKVGAKIQGTIFSNIARMNGNIAEKNYMKLFSKFKDLSNIFYGFGLKDRNVGRLTGEEIKFLEDKKVLVKGYPGGHVMAQEKTFKDGLDKWLPVSDG